VAALLFVPACGLAAWWQVTRATDGNGLSYLYAVEWPIFAILSVYFWWMLIHTDYESVGLRGMRSQVTVTAPAGAAASPGPAPSPVVVPDTVPEHFGLPVDDELAAYNARLAELAARGPKTWRKPETLVARRPK
jgi:DNA-binding transcriptional regulator of glucitol operon